MTTTAKQQIDRFAALDMKILESMEKYYSNRISDLQSEASIIRRAIKQQKRKQRESTRDTEASR